MEPGAGSYDTTALSASIFQTLFSKILSTYLTRVFTTYMPKISQVHNHWVWKISGSKGLTQYCLCTPILCWNWNLWSCRDSVRQRNFSLKFQIKAVCLAFSIIFKWKKHLFASYPHIVCWFMPFYFLFEDILPFLFYNRNSGHPHIWGFQQLPEHWSQKLPQLLLTLCQMLLKGFQSVV